MMEWMNKKERNLKHALIGAIIFTLLPFLFGLLYQHIEENRLVKEDLLANTETMEFIQKSKHS